MKPAFRAKLERAGREHALIYKAIVLSGLRKAELARLTVGQVHFDGDGGYIELRAAENNRKGSYIPLRPDLADDLRRHTRERALEAQNAARATGEPMPAALPLATKLFAVPDQLVRIRLVAK